jgi:hypothetical protein
MARTRSRLTPTRRRRITARAFHYAARSGHLIATTLWITFLATGIALQFLYGITLGFAEGIGQLKKELKAARLERQKTGPGLLPKSGDTAPAIFPKTRWNYGRSAEKK